MSYTAAEIAALDSGLQRIGVFFRMATSPVVALWLGHGDIEPGVDALDETGRTYKGFGKLVDVPPMRQLLNGTFERVEFSLSGVDQATLDAAATDEVRDAETSLGIGIMDADWALLGPIHWRATYYADYMSRHVQGASEPGGQATRVVSLSVSSIMSGRKRARFSYLTDAHQKAISPGDKACEHTINLQQGVDKPWPRDT